MIAPLQEKPAPIEAGQARYEPAHVGQNRGPAILLALRAPSERGRPFAGASRIIAIPHHAARPVRPEERRTFVFVRSASARWSSLALPAAGSTSPSPDPRR